MNKNLKNILAALAVFVLAGVLLTLGYFWGGAWQHRALTSNYGPGSMMGNYGDDFSGDYGPGMMWQSSDDDGQGSRGRGMMGGSRTDFSDNYGPGMMGNYGDDFSGGYGPGMMGNFSEGFSGNYGPGSMMNGYGADFSGSYGHGMMGNYSDNFSGSYGHAGIMGGNGGNGGYGQGMMGSYGWQTGEAADPLSIDENHEILEAFLVEKSWDDQFEVSEIMIFDNHAYAQLVEIESGIGAYEVLIDAATREVYPEHGANMMWNLKYGMHTSDADVSAEMSLSAVEAVTFAQAYLDEYLVGTTADDHAVPFYGYYTLHILQDAEIVGMLSVYGESGEVLLHTWHGDLIEMSEHLRD